MSSSDQSGNEMSKIKEASEKKISAEGQKQLRKKPEAQADLSYSLAIECARAAIDKKAENLKILDVSETSGFTDYFVICSAMSDRQIQAIARGIDEHVKKQTGRNPLSLEGMEDARWVLIDYGDAVVHIFLDAVRDYYGLEELWSNAKKVKVPSDLFGSAGSVH